MNFFKKITSFIKKILFGNERPVLRNILSAVFHFISLFMLDFGFRFIYRKDDLGITASYIPLLMTLFWCLIICGIALALPRLARRIYVIATTLLYVILAATHGILDSFFGQYLSFSSFMFADEGAGFFDISYFAIPKKFIALLLLCLFISVISALILPKRKYSYICAIVAAALFIGGVTGAVITDKTAFKDESGGIGWASKKTASDYYDEFTDYRTVMHMCGLYQYTYKDLVISTGLEDFFVRFGNGYSELDEYYENKETDPDNEMTGKFKDKNLILIQLESIDTWMLNEAAMPTLTALQSESINFTNFYAPKYLWAATFNSENLVNTGTISPTNSSKISYFTKTEYPESMPNLFAKKGYTVNSFHRSNESIYSRGEIHTNWGYENYYSGGEMGLSDYDLDSYLMEAYELFAPDEKFMSFIITYTGHGPYNNESAAVKLHEDTIRPKLPEDVKDEYVYALCHAYETDLFVKELIERLEKDGKLDDTVLIFYTDHYDHYITDDSILTEYKGTDSADLRCEVPFFIYSKDTEPATIDKAVATYDVLPTVANLFDLDTDGRYYIGNDAFSENGGYIIFPSYSWYDGETYYNVYAPEETELSKKRNREISERLNASWDSIKLNYFKRAVK